MSLSIVLHALGDAMGYYMRGEGYGMAVYTYIDMEGIACYSTPSVATSLRCLIP
jgi:hypothetical protein